MRAHLKLMLDTINGLLELKPDDRQIAVEYIKSMGWTSPVHINYAANCHYFGIDKANKITPNWSAAT
jgi:hypothetical protein